MTHYKIIMIGCSGSGKSTLTRELTESLEIPVLHLDRVWHTTNYDDEAKKFLRQTQLDFMTNNADFIVDGNYAGSLDVRVLHANLIIWFQIPRHVCIYRVISRSVKRKLRLETRSDMADEFKEKFDREYVDFLKFVWNFEKNSTPQIEAALEKKNADCKVVVIRNKRDKERLLQELCA